MTGLKEKDDKNDNNDNKEAAERKYRLLNLKHYEFIKNMGKGTYGKIDIYRKDNEEFVVKTMPDGDHLSQAVREIEIYKKLDHPNILQYQAHRYGSDSTLLLDRGRCSLGDFISNGDYDVPMYINWMYQIIRAVDYLHYHRLIHTDLKPQNVIMFRDANKSFYPKLADLGCCQYYQDDQEMNCYIQTEYYRSPEIKRHIDQKKYYAQFDYKIDIWSLGIIMIDMLCHTYTYTKFDYYASTHLAKIKSFCQKNRYLQITGDGFTALIDMIKETLQTKPEARIDISGLVHHDYWKCLENNKLNLSSSADSDSNSNSNSNSNNNTTSKLKQTKTKISKPILIKKKTITEISPAVGGPPVPVVINVGSGQSSGTSTSSEVVSYGVKYNDEPFHYGAFHKHIFRYPMKNSELLDMFPDYYSELPKSLVIDGFYYALRLKKKIPKMNFLKLNQYCIYVLCLFYDDQSMDLKDLTKTVFRFRKREVFQVLNATDFVIF